MTFDPANIDPDAKPDHVNPNAPIAVSITIDVPSHNVRLTQTQLINVHQMVLHPRVAINSVINMMQAELMRNYDRLVDES